MKYSISSPLRKSRVASKRAQKVQDTDVGAVVEEVAMTDAEKPASKLLGNKVRVPRLLGTKAKTKKG